MAISVICPSCHARFQVHDKFAGKQGPCPKCKGVITIPALDDQVKIHEPEFGGAGAKDSKGRSVLKPLERVETKVQPVLLAGIAMAVVLAFAVALVLRGSEAKTSPLVLGLGAAVLAPPLAVGGYSFLRNQELEPYRGVELGIRAAICGAVYAALWGAIWAMKHFFLADSLESWNTLYLLAPPLVVGSVAALSTLDLDFGSGFFHYALYLSVCVLLRLTMGLPLL